MRRLAAEWASFLLACQFLTRLPVPARWDAARMAAAPRWYPAAGLVVGALAAGAYLIAATRFSPDIAALAALATGMLVTGCLHEDGFADVCDGLGGNAPRARALEIMRDSRLGTYGVAGLALMLLGQWQALAGLGAGLAPLAPLALLAGHAASRASCVVVMATSRYARPEGAATSVSGGVGPGSVAVALGVAALPFALLLLRAPAAAAAGVAGLVLAHLLARAWFERRLGGYTGDCLGAVQQTGMLAFSLGVLGWS